MRASFSLNTTVSPFLHLPFLPSLLLLYPLSPLATGTTTNRHRLRARVWMGAMRGGMWERVLLRAVADLRLRRELPGHQLRVYCGGEKYVPVLFCFLFLFFSIFFFFCFLFS